MMIDAEVPTFLRPYITKQNYEMYTAIDHASWRYIMRVSKAFFKNHAHPKYLTGLDATGITTDRIPKISEMDERLKKFGWRAAAITGFIPPAVFLEFLAYKILPIACDMRTLRNLEYTPAPDIVHEAAGHAPIIADPKYSAYLGKFGEIARKAIFAKEDLDVYRAVLHLSEIKENSATTADEVDRAYEKLKVAISKVAYVSEATKLSRLGWWSTEYGLVRQNDQYLMYGAGLLSSVGESYDAIHKNVPRMRLTLDCVNVNFDITKPQPQLFYIDDFQELETVVEHLASTMAFRRGGVYGLHAALKAQTVTTTRMDSGLQISGVLKKYEVDSSNKPYYLQFDGPSQLACNDCEILGHGANYHKAGFGAPIGKIAGLDKSVHSLNEADFKALNLNENEWAQLKFESGIIVKGIYRRCYKVEDRPLVLTFDECTVCEDKVNGKVFFKPEWGAFDLGAGDLVTSVFGGAADRAASMQATEGDAPKVRAQTSNLTEETLNLNALYLDVRSIRESGVLAAAEISRLYRVAYALREQYPMDWLLRSEILELILNRADASSQVQLRELELEIRKDLAAISKSSSNLATLTQRYVF